MYLGADKVFSKRSSKKRKGLRQEVAAFKKHRRGGEKGKTTEKIQRVGGKPCPRRGVLGMPGGAKRKKKNHQVNTKKKKKKKPPAFL